MKPIGGHLLPALAVIPALVVTGASLIALISGVGLDAGRQTTDNVVVTQPAPTQVPQGRTGVKGQMPSVVAVQVQPERLPHPATRAVSTGSRHTALASVVVRPPSVAQPQPSGNVSEDRSGSNSGSGSSNSGEARGGDGDDDSERNDDRGHGGHGDDDRHDDDHGHDDHDHEDDE